MPTRTTDLIGRDRDLAALAGALDRVADGAPATVLVGGEAGVGKTRLVREFTERVADRARILAGGCVERGADGLPFAPFTAALRGLTAGLGRTRLADLLPAGGPGELPRVLPGLGKPDRDTDPGSARARLFEGMLGLLGNVAARQPTALVIEDAHWAAGSSRDLLDFLVRNQPPLLIIVTYRSDELERTHPLRAMLAELDRVGWVSRRELARLARPEVAALIRGVLGEEPRPELVDLVQRRSEGNPLFVEALLAGGAPGDAALPESLRDLLLAPVHRLPGGAREVLAVAAAGGVRVGHALLAAVAGVDDPSLSEALRAAVSGNVLVADGDGTRSGTHSSETPSTATSYPVSESGGTCTTPRRWRPTPRSCRTAARRPSSPTTGTPPGICPGHSPRHGARPPTRRRCWRTPKRWACSTGCWSCGHRSPPRPN